MNKFSCLVVPILALVLSAEASFDSKSIYVTKNGNAQRFTASDTAGDGFYKITGDNAKPGEIPYFTGYDAMKSVPDGTGSITGFQKYCEFDVELRAHKKGSSYVLSAQPARNGYTDTGVSVWVAGYSCRTLNVVPIYYASCRNGGSRFGRVGTSRNQCGSATEIYESEVYAYVGKPLCKDLPSVPHLDKTPQYDGPRITKYTFQCQWGYELKGATSITCNDRGSWSAQPPRCPAKKCSVLRPPANGALSTSDRGYQTSVTYVCNSGYQQDPASDSITCDGNGEWSHHAHMSCKAIDCSTPVMPRHGNVRELATTYGETVYYYCERSYKLEGSATATCQADGRWRYPSGHPSCQAIRCPALAHPQGGRAVLNGRTVGDQASFTCDTGYMLVGEQSIHCRKVEDVGQWSGSVPRCIIKVCERPVAPQNGQVLGTRFSYGAEIQFLCDPGFSIQGADRAVCRSSGWDAATPTCAAIACRDPGTPEHGSRDGESFGYGVVVTFTCDAGYTRNGAESITCEETGRWSGRRPQCEAVECPAIRAPRRGSRDGDQTTFPAKVTFSCFPGYEMEGESESSCQANRQWSSPVPTCKACQQGYYRDATVDKCTKCPSHSTTATTASTSKLQCTCVDGSSGPQGGPCTVVECEALTAPEHGRILPCSRIQDSECEAACDAGYVLSSGTRRRRCTADGWSGNAAKCTACPPNTYKMHAGSTACQPCPANTVTVPGVPAQTRDACVCAPGFRSLGQGTPCLDVDECLLNNGGCNQVCENTEGSFTCSCSIPGYLLGDDGKTCTLNRTCERLAQRPNNGFLNCRYTERTNGYICFIKCMEGHFFVSGENNYLTCGSGSQFEWSHRVMNKTARIPACTREFFIDIDLPITLKYQGSAGCTPEPMSASALQQRLEDAVNTIPQCRGKCIVHDVTMDCSGSGANTAITVKADVTLFNPHPNEVPLNCTRSCKTESMISMIRDSFQVAKEIKKIIENRTTLLELEAAGAPLVDKAGSTAIPHGKPQMLCDEGQVLTSTRLCVPCDRGYHLPDRALKMCKPCKVGFYQDEQGQVKCKKCLTGSTTLAEGSDHPTMCNVRADPAINTGSDTSDVDDVTEENAAAILDDPTLGL